MSSCDSSAPETPSSQPYSPIMSYRRRCREQATHIYFMAQKEALIDALDQKDYDTIRSIVDEMRGIGTPMIWVEQAVGAVSVLILNMMLYLIDKTISNDIIRQNCRNGLVLLALILGRFWFTFRERLAVWVDFQVEHPYALVRECNRRFIKTLAVGDPAYCAAPLPQSWAGLTGRERQQSGWERDLCLILTILASTVLFFIGVVGFLFIPFIYQLTLPAQTSNLVYWSITTLFLPISFIGFLLAWGMEYVVTAKFYRVMLYFGYNRDTAHPILRGFTDQMLHTYCVRNTSRLSEKQRDDEAAIKED